jgi:hypothetical protein
MDQTRVAEKMFENKPKHKKEVGMAKLRRLEDTENNLRELKVKRCR